ncbi:hypothetical protein N7490_005214 [Penicillium lividum]|nr:hypothetical protein N7490_005214 [Penicillium lividum]
MDPKKLMYKFPIPRSYRNKLAGFFEMIILNSQYYGLTNMMLETLTATEVSLAAHFLGIDMKTASLEKYLNPLRDLEPDMVICNELILQGCELMILGDGVQDLLERILHPQRFWTIWSAQIHRGILPPLPDLWVVALHPKSNKASMMIHDVLNTEDYTAATRMFNEKILIQVKRLFIQKHLDPHFRVQGIGVNLGRSSVRSLRLESLAKELLTGVNINILKPSYTAMGTYSMCKVGGCTAMIKWDKVYEDIYARDRLPYLHYTNGKVKLKYADRKTDFSPAALLNCKDTSLILWKGSAFLPHEGIVGAPMRNYIFEFMVEKTGIPTHI